MNVTEEISAHVKANMFIWESKEDTHSRENGGHFKVFVVSSFSFKGSLVMGGDGIL